MKEAALVIIKPDGIAKGIYGDILTKFSNANLELIGMRVVKVSKKLAEEHYKHIKDKPFFKQVIEYLVGKYHKENKVIAIVYCGDNGIKKCRAIAGATNPEEAFPKSVRGSYGRVTTKGVYENVVHVSSNSKEADREIKLWFCPGDLIKNIYPIKFNNQKRRIWA